MPCCRALDGVEREREKQRQPEHDGHLNEENQRGAAEPENERGVLKRAHIVPEGDELRTADECVREKAQVSRVGERGDEHRCEHEKEREDEAVGNEVLLSLDRIVHLESLRSGE